MFYTYALFSKTHNKIYVGYSSDLNSRLSAHNHPQNKGWTAKFQPWELIYYEEFSTKEEALAREKQLKTARGRLFIRSIIKH
jgi:putative endonuclease